MAKSKTRGEMADQQGIDDLRERYRVLNERSIRAKADLENAEKQLSELRRKAREAYGTDDLDELKKQLEALKAENEARRAAYQQSLEKIEADLAKVETEDAAQGDDPRP